MLTRNSSEDEIANVNFLYDDIVQNAIDLCINSATDRRGGYITFELFRVA